MLFNEIFYENNQPFNPLLHIREAGELNADKNYVIERKDSKTNVIAYITSGILNITINGKSINLYQGNCVILPHDQDYSIRSDPFSPCNMLWINIRGSLFDASYDVLFNEIDLVIADLNIEDLFSTIKELLAQKNNNHTKITKLILNILLDLQDNLSIPSKKQNPITGNNNYQSMDHYVSTQLQHRFSVSEMARTFHLSVDQLNRSFKKEFGITPYKYYQKIRIQLATSLLLNTNLSIDDISERLAFYNRNAFSNCFKAYNSVTPAKYRIVNKSKYD